MVGPKNPGRSSDLAGLPRNCEPGMRALVSAEAFYLDASNSTMASDLLLQEFEGGFYCELPGGAIGGSGAFGPQCFDGFFFDIFSSMKEGYVCPPNANLNFADLVAAVRARPRRKDLVIPGISIGPDGEVLP